MKTRSSFLLLAISVSVSVLNIVCKDEIPVKPEPPIKEMLLTLSDTTCTEVWLTLSFRNYSAPHTYKIYRETTMVFSGTILSNDTTFIDEGLKPKREYLYTAFRYEQNSTKDSTTTKITTMDTTSHEIDWEIHYFGDYGSNNVIKDIAIIDDDDIWAVGEINLYDSLGQRQSEQYGFVRRDGMEWKIFKIYALYNLGVQFTYSLLPISIKAFKENDIWFANGSVYHWDGDTITAYYINKFPGNPNPIWMKDRQGAKIIGGSFSNDLFALGENGALAHFNGTSWKNIETNTNFTGQDIFVNTDSENRATGIYGLFSIRSATIGTGSKLFKLNKDRIESEILLPGIKEEVVSLYGVNKKGYYLSGIGLYTRRTLNDSSKWEDIQPIVTPYATGKVSGTGVNDVYVIGSFGEFLHFNGYSWKSFQKHPLFKDVEFSKVVVRNKTVIATGMFQNFNKAVILVGKQH
jgi:hypothetical protein